ncbi:MAG: hypothetical protein C0506_05150 [Anaerolinea sp.]|nr:hypothetical protein [Anaerolinea sp.]
MTSESEPAAEPGQTRESKLQGLRSKIGEFRPDDLLLLDELTDQLERTRRLLRGETEEAAEAALARFSGQAEVEARIAAELAVSAPLAQPDRFGEAHRLAMRAVEVLEREGSRSPRVPRLGPLRPVVEAGAEYIAEYIVKSYAENIVTSLKKLYARREAQCAPQAPERRLIAHARLEMDRVAPTYSGGGLGAPFLLLGGLLVPLVASVTQYAGAIDFANRWVLFGGLGVLSVLFFLLSGMLLAGASVARRRSKLIMHQPLAALWETVGHAGRPPEDDATLFALAALILTAMLWFVLPAAGAVIYFVL